MRMELQDPKTVLRNTVYKLIMGLTEQSNVSNFALNSTPDYMKKSANTGKANTNVS